MKKGAELIAEERATHEAKGWTALHDDQHTSLDMPPVAIHLIMDHCDPAHDWGLVEKTKREGGRIRQLVVAGALLAAEIDRLQRAFNRGIDPK
jgi:hypothetical protein